MFQAQAPRALPLLLSLLLLLAPAALRAEVAELAMLSAHADSDELMRWLRGFTKAPERASLEFRVGGFGGVLAASRYAAVVADAAC